MSEKLGIMVCGHGSRNQNAAKEFAKVSEGLRKLYPELPVEYGYLEFCNPVISHSLDALREQGVTRCLAVPGMLFAAGHAKNDIPSVLNTYQSQNMTEADFDSDGKPDIVTANADSDSVAVFLNRASLADP